MPKMKTHSGTKKRFRLTGKGKVMRERASATGTASRRSRPRHTRRLGKDVVTDKADVKRVKRLLGKG